MDKQQFNKPIFKHDCDKCEFIEGFMLEEKRFDLYRCESDSPGISYIARYSHRGGDYWSMPWNILKYLNAEGYTLLLSEVQKRAKLREKK